MATKRNPPFRAEHVGSLHRPGALREARVKLLGGLGAKGRPGNHGNAELTQIENGFIAEAVQMQEAIGLKTITDGEFRRQTWLNDFLGSLTGIGFALVRDPSASAKRSEERRVGKECRL